ncbi:MAG: DNA polymerase III subunit gamma/tau [Planctomycetota bacterium]
MAYTVLARKYRSRTFDEVIGQEPIATTLVNAIKTGRIHHGYLFTGTRGVGKTSMARIMAKALNCLEADGPTVDPCCKCNACTAIAEGQDIDVVEIDAASNTGVDNIRELRSNTAYRPARARYKVYIIDEVHMLSTGAFNALLKTLEEPPEHVKFILATTEIQKVPATIQSRCQRFNFQNIGPDAIAKRLGEIAKEEGAKSEEVVLRRVARLARGSMRDALSILDQLLSVSPKKLTAKLLDELLPPAQDERVLALLQQIAASDVGAVLRGVEDLLDQGRGLEVFCNDMIETLRSLMLIKACGPDAPMVDLPADNRDEYVALSAEYKLSQYVQMITLLEELRRNVRFSGAGRALTDAAMVRLAHMRQWGAIEQIIAGWPVTGQADEKKKPIAPARPAETEDQRREPVPQTPAQSVTKRPAKPRPKSEYPPDEVEYSHEVDVPDDYVPEEAAPEAPRTHGARGGVTSEERARILRDPVVQQVMDLFDGELVYVERAARASSADSKE